MITKIFGHGEAGGDTWYIVEIDGRIRAVKESKMD